MGITRAFNAQHLAQPGYDYHGGDYADYDDAAVCLRIWRSHKDRHGQLRQLFIAGNLADGYRIRRRLHFTKAVYRCKERADGAFHYHANQALVGIVGSRVYLACFQCAYCRGGYPCRALNGLPFQR